MTQSLPAESHVGRVALRATDRDRVAHFYRSVVGLAELDRSADRTVLGVDDRPLLEVVAAPDAAERDRFEAGLFHVAFRVPDRAALADALARVEDRWELGGASDHRVSEAVYLTDPEGNGVEIYRDRPRDEWPETDDGGVDMDTLPLDLDDLREEAGAATDGSGDPAGRLPAGSDVGHVHLEVSSLDDATAFYVDGLGLGERARYGASALFLAAGDYHHHVGLNTWNGRTEPGEGRGLDSWELVVPDAAVVDAVAERLVESDGDHEVQRDGDTLVTTDPDGITVRIRPEAA